MPKKIVSLNKTNQDRIAQWVRKTISKKKIDDTGLFHSLIESLILDEVKTHKECTEKAIVEAYFNAMETWLDNHEWDGNIPPQVIHNARIALSKKYTSGHNFTNNIDIYFNDVKREYIMHPMNESDFLEFVPDNREVFIKNNLKLVINCAKRYRGLGLPFEDLIQVGNYGLLVAFDKFDKDRANLRNAIMTAIEKSRCKSFKRDDAITLVTKCFLYDKDLERTIKTIPEEGFKDKDQFRNWTKNNVKTAVFASVAFQWIRAYILLELSKQTTTVKMPKSSSKKHLTEDEIIAGVTDESSLPAVVSLDSVNPHTNDNYHDNQMSSAAVDAFAVEDAMIDSKDNEKLFHDIIYKAIAGLSDINRRIIKKRFGIGYPCPLNISDIAESEGIANNRTKYIISSCLNELAKRIPKKDKAILLEIFGGSSDDH